MDSRRRRRGSAAYYNCSGTTAAKTMTKRDTRERRTRTRRIDAEKQTEPPRRVHRARDRRAVDKHARGRPALAVALVPAPVKMRTPSPPPRHRLTPRPLPPWITSQPVPVTLYAPGLSLNGKMFPLTPSTTTPPPLAIRLPFPPPPLPIHRRSFSHTFQ